MTVVFDRLLRVTGKLPVRLPVVSQLAEQQFRRSYHGFRGVYPSFETAQDSAPEGSSTGYDNEEAASYYRERLNRIYPADYPVIFWLRELFERGVDRVFDLGGHVGVAYYAYQKYLKFPDTLQWRICDVPEVCESGRQLAKERGVTNLTFTSDFSDASEFSILFTSGATQYLECSLAERFRNLSKVPDHLIYNLVPLTPHDTFYTLQTIGVSFCPYRVESHSAFHTELEGLDYKLIDAWENPEKECFIPFHPERSLDHYNGGYLRRASASF